MNKIVAKESKAVNIDRENYIEKRLNEQINWYDNAANKYKNAFSYLSLIVLAINAIIPIVILFSDNFTFQVKLITVILSSGASICTGIVQFFKCQDVWIKYRMVCEELTREKILYETKCDKYNDNDEALDLLILTCEKVMSGERNKWQFVNTGKVKVSI